MPKPAMVSVALVSALLDRNKNRVSILGLQGPVFLLKDFVTGQCGMVP